MPPASSTGKQLAAKAALVALAVVNVVAIVPSAVFSILLGQYVPTLAIVTLSLAAWAVGCSAVRRRRHTKAAKAADIVVPARP
ncbi:hypothetical protein ACGFJT_36950 [Actinomadura geliboluensis]|uniref:hypothetical protein n=1 Tax=Actinomadura geliboluensis TaxID=882440 RepID=UPI0037163C8F